MKRPPQVSAKDEHLLEELLSKKGNAVEPRDGFRMQLLSRLLRMQAEGVKHPPSFAVAAVRWLHRVHAAWAGGIAALLILAIGVTAGYAYLSPEVTRESPFYSWKRLIESVELRLADGGEQQVKTELKLSTRRGEEAKVLSDKGIVDAPTLGEMARRMNQALDTARQLPPSSERSSLLQESAHNERLNLSSIVQRVLRRTIEREAVHFQNDGSPVAKDVAAPLQEPKAPPDMLPTQTMRSLEQQIGDLQMVEGAMGGGGSIPSNVGVTETIPANVVMRIKAPVRFTAAQSGSLVIELTSPGVVHVAIVTTWNDGTKESVNYAFLKKGKNVVALSHRFAWTGIYEVKVRVQGVNGGTPFSIAAIRVRVLKYPERASQQKK